MDALKSAENHPSPTATPGVPVPPVTRLASPLAHGITLVIGLLLGVFIMFVLRTEMKHLRDSAAKYVVLLGLAMALGIALIPSYLRLRRLLLTVFGADHGAALLHGVSFLLLAGVVVVSVVCSLFFLALA